jgi:hypothetical protein
MRSATGSGAGAGDAGWACAGVGACGWLPRVAGGAVAACCGNAGGEAGALAAVKAGAVWVGNNETGFWAVWHADPAITVMPNTAIHPLSFATRIVAMRYGAVPKFANYWILSKSYSLPSLGSTPKRHRGGYLRHQVLSYVTPISQTAEAGSGLVSTVLCFNSHPPVIRTPNLNRLLDIFRG